MRGRFGWGIGGKKNQLIILPEITAARVNVSMGAVRRGSSS